MKVPLDVAASICGVRPGTIYRWVADRRILAYPPEEGDTRGWYDVAELLQWIDSRDPDALRMRAGMGGDPAAGMSRRGVVARTNYNRVRSTADSHVLDRPA